MTEQEQLIAQLVDKDAAACRTADGVVEESETSARFYPYLDHFTALLHHKNSLVRNRALSILAANARWDTENRYEALLDEILVHITDEKPITARWCIRTLPQIAAAKPQLALRICTALEQADVSGYQDSMRPLLRADIENALQLVRCGAKDQSAGT